ncbi:hypothetical protein KAI87_17920, partial [Myxococcota bacterium]|nr:hypothetical protein [Myxococcota bacterium]
MQKKILKEGFKNTGRIILALALLAPFGCGESSCNDPGYQYPFESPGSGISPQVVRTRITEWGLTTLARAIPGVLVDSCTPEVGDVAERSCFLETDSSTGSDIAQFYLGKPEDDPGDDSTGIRSGGVCSSCPGGAYHRSTLGFYLDSLENNILLRPVPGADGGHLEMILGCDPDASTCLSSQHIRGAIDMVFLPGYQACSMTNGVEEGYGFVLEWLKVSIKMRVVEDESGHRFLNVADDDIEVKDGDISLKIDMALIDAADDDPACDGALCDVTCGSSDIAIDFTAGLLTDLFKDEVIKLLTTGITSALGGDELDGSGHVNTGELIPLPNQNTNEVGYYLGANLSTPDVSGPIGNYGLNFDTDMGLSAEHHPCVPPVPAPPVQGGPMPEPDVLVPVIEEA